jgi:hypothetical protein
MDAKIRNAIKAAEKDPTPENIDRVQDLFRRHGIRFCGCEHALCPICRGEGCYYPADPITQINMLGSICTKCVETTPLQYHGSVDPRRDVYISCGCKWCNNLLKWVEEVLRTNKRDAEVLATEIVPDGFQWERDVIRLHLWEGGRANHAFLPMHSWPLFGEYLEALRRRLDRP